jgi:hypothetical protein
VGALAAAQQQWRHLARHNQPNPDPRNHFISNIIKFIKQLQRNHHDIYLMGDYNESEGAAPIWRIYNECNLVSVFHSRPEETPRGPTYIPAGTSPDHHACTPRIHQLILSRGIITNGPPSDHLNMFANLNTKGVFGNATTNPTALPGRVLNSKSPKKVDTNVAYLSATMTNHQLFSRIERLSARCAQKGHALPGDARLFQTIDAEHTRLQHAAEKRCGQLSYGHPLSLELRSAGENIHFLKRQRQEAYLRRAMEPPEARARTNNLLVQFQTELKRTWKHMKNTQTKAAKLRSRSNTERATRQSQQGNKDDAEILSEINKKETRTNTFHKIKRYLFPEQNSGSQMGHGLVESTEPDGTKSTREVTAPTELFETLLEQNKADFSRADGTPFTVPPMSDELPTFHWSDNAQRILNGTYKPPAEVSEEMRLFIHTAVPKQHASNRHQYYHHRKRPTRRDSLYSGKDLIVTFKHACRSHPSGTTQ